MKKLVAESLIEWNKINEDIFADTEEKAEVEDPEAKKSDVDSELKGLDQAAAKLGKSIAKTVIKKGEEQKSKGGDEKKEETNESLNESLQKPLNEAAVLTVATVVLGAPQILSMISKLIKTGSKLIKSKKGEDAAEALKKFSDKLERGMIKPITWSLQKVFKLDKEVAEKWAHIIHLIIVGGLTLASGLDLMKGIKTANTALTAEEVGKLGVKIPEILKGIKGLAAGAH